MLGYDSYISKANPSGVWSVTDDQFAIGLADFRCNWNTKYVTDNYNKSMSSCSYSNTPSGYCEHVDDLVITCLGIYKYNYFNFKSYSHQKELLFFTYIMYVLYFTFRGVCEYGLSKGIKIFFSKMS